MEDLCKPDILALARTVSRGGTSSVSLFSRRMLCLRSSSSVGSDDSSDSSFLAAALWDLRCSFWNGTHPDSTLCLIIQVLSGTSILGVRHVEVYTTLTDLIFLVHVVRSFIL